MTNLDIEKLIRISEEQSARVKEMQERAAELEGHAESADRRIKVTCTTAGGVSDIQIDPRAMRMPAADFAEALKNLIKEATDDLHRQLSELMAETYGEAANPMALVQNQEAVQERIQQAAVAYDRTLDDAMSELERIAKQLGL
ncbi:YbaB/EbfC family nucleoid-associated protein [Actinomadura sp. DC4]|uniref:YbaB/EbfC family nucleoid-associated protein n=1 Tax=Actinomadura sp. DC4 TaxID=3055069 RepID=UPI0025AEFEF3|nr:YbaB/EbfC family nucleoid-associated protein [Actinomadura sp. DC4]MDN3359710.1 YbaB/EbfC family nucleoid-associated protein [Actinomadura sp. DC4]